MKRVLAAVLLGLSIAASAGIGTTVAAPINCPDSQVAVHRGGDQWDCVNKAGNSNESDAEKNDHHAN